MTEKSNKLEETKKLLRAFLLSAPGGCTMRQLSTDYTELNGCNIPYKLFGFLTLEAFLRTIPDVVTMRSVTSGGQRGYLLLGVADSSTQHIKDLVGKQKNSTSGYCNPYKDIKKTGGRLREPRSTMVDRSFQNYEYSHPNRSPFVQVKSSNYVQGQLNRLNPSVPVPRHFDSNERPSSKSFAPFIPPRLRVVRNPERNQIKTLLGTYPNGLRISNFERAYNQMHGIDFHYASHGFRSLKECLESIADIVQLVPDSDSFKLYPAGVKFENSNSEKKNVLSEDTSSISEKFKIELRSVLLHFPNGIYLNMFPTEYERLTKKTLQYTCFGFSSVFEMVGELKDVFSMRRPDKNKDFLLFNAEKAPASPLTVQNIAVNSPPKAAPVSTSLRTKSHLSDIKSNVEKVLLTYPDGIRLKEFEEIYKGNCQEDMPWKELGFDSVSKFLVALGGPIQLIPCKSGTLLIIHNSHAGSTVESLSVREFILYKIPEYPVDPVLPGTDYKYMTITADMCTEKYIAVIVSHVYSPSDLYFQIRGMDTTEQLEKLMTSLDLLYNSEEGKKYVIPDEYLKPSLICAAIYPDDNNWHRGKLINFVSPNTVNIFYVDYGTTFVVKKKYLRYLRKDFLRLPALAINARLANVKPLNNLWSPAAKTKILSLVNNIPMMAYICSITYKNTISLRLCDVRGEDDIFVHLKLIDQNLAEYSSDNENEEEQSSPETHKSPETPSPSNSMGMTEWSYQVYMEYMKYMNYQYFYGLNASMAHLRSAPDARGVDLKVLEKIGSAGLSSEKKAVETNGFSASQASEHPQETEVFSSACTSPVPPDGNERESPDGGANSDDGIASTDLAADTKQEKFSKVISLNDYDLHLINYRGKAYMTSVEISHFIWGTDILKKVVR